MQSYSFNPYEQTLVDAFAAMIPQIIASDSLVNVEHVHIECARLLLIAAYKTKHAPRQWVCNTFEKDRHWLNNKNL